uniref:Uncharacterized protein n=1 Tax=Syphacia muris TaxID=451379 RepID=A0A0N5AZS0_9BILA
MEQGREQITRPVKSRKYKEEDDDDDGDDDDCNNAVAVIRNHHHHSETAIRCSFWGSMQNCAQTRRTTKAWSVV